MHDSLLTYAKQTAINPATLDATVADNPAYFHDLATSRASQRFLAQIALNERVVAYREDQEWASFDLADYAEIRDLAAPLFALLEPDETIETDEPCLIWASPWAIRVVDAADYALTISVFSHETDERCVNLERLDADSFERLRTIFAKAKRETKANYSDPMILADLLGVSDDYENALAGCGLDRPCFNDESKEWVDTSIDPTLFLERFNALLAS